MGEEGAELESKMSSLRETRGEPGGEGSGVEKVVWNSSMAVMVDTLIGLGCGPDDNLLI